MTTTTAVLPALRAALSADGYEIPDVRLRRRRVPLAAFLSLAIIALWCAYRAGQDLLAVRGFDHQALLWTTLMLAASHQTVLAWFDRPYTATPRQRALLDELYVTVSVPVFNESREVVDRVLFALLHQDRLPQRIDVVDDGSRIDYSVIREFWREAFWAAGITFTWTRQANAGKRHAQAVTFRDAPDGIVLTLDSDTTLARDAIAEILKPFTNRRVQSVAGVELARNQNTNVLTRINGMRQLAWQLVGCSALNRFGAILVNRGTFAAYRAALVRETVDAYLAETFAGKPVKYSDDSLLTLYALGRGRAVQQISAFQLAEYPDRLSHALRQWIRWMRGSTIRSIWRARYLRVGSYAWFINVLNWWQLLASSAAYAYVFAYLPFAGRLSLSAISAAVANSYLANVRSLLVARSDQSALSQLDTFLLSPLSWAYSLLVLRPLRVYGMLTCANNGWGTRSVVEVGMEAQQPRNRDGATVPLPVAPDPHPARGRRRGARKQLLPIPAPLLATVAAVTVAVGATGAVVAFSQPAKSPAQQLQVLPPTVTTLPHVALASASPAGATPSGSPTPAQAVRAVVSSPAAKRSSAPPATSARTAGGPVNSPATSPHPSQSTVASPTPTPTPSATLTTSTSSASPQLGATP